MLFALGLLLNCSSQHTWLDRYSQSYQSLFLSSRVPQVYRNSFQCNLLASTLHFLNLILMQFKTFSAGLASGEYGLIIILNFELCMNSDTSWYMNWHIIRYKHKFYVIKFVLSFSKFSKLSYKFYDSLFIGGTFDSHNTIEAHFWDCTYKCHVDLYLMQLNITFITYWWPTIKLAFSCVKAKLVGVD